MEERKKSKIKKKEAGEIYVLIHFCGMSIFLMVLTLCVCTGGDEFTENISNLKVKESSMLTADCDLTK